MSRTAVRAAVGAIALLLVLSASPAYAGDGNRGRGSRTLEYPLPGTDVFPEGIDTFGRYFYVTSTSTGDVFRGEVRDTDSVEVFLPGGEDGRTTAVGIEATEDLLIVAGGATGTVFVYERDSGELLASHTVPEGGPAFLNDIAVTRDGDVYVTDSPRDVVYRIPEDAVAEGGELEVFASFAGVDPAGQFNANGIVATRDGRYLIVVQSDTGTLLRVSTADASVQPIDLDGATVVAGDGLELKGGRTLYVVRNSAGVITEVRLEGRFTEGRVVSETTDPTFRFPTTAALDRGRLLVVNSQFDQRGGDPVEPFTVSSIKRP
ncbi:SMP-30/gluconolactonase/LRE family protein [Naasia sp. SYSU D00948]|uniref:SMP-30/gluconolactonase/LRE family protein n=1 Tax=Naasia sp. SYSU D00948 TaxID=2817379 RepID=UPI001B30E0C2|nr:hypothetical protein [Naasia sp. SYSU D00948]